MTLEDARAPPEAGSPRPRPLFRPEALREPLFGEVIAFSVPSWGSITAVAAASAILFTTFSSLVTFDRTASLRGVVVPSTGLTRLVAPQQGLVADLLVRQGESVERGRPLLRIASIAALPPGEQAAARTLDAVRERERSLLAERAAEGDRRAAERLRLTEEEAELRDAIASSEQQIALQARRIESNEERLRNLRPLRDRGYVSIVAYQVQEEAVLALRQQMEALRLGLAEQRHRLRSARHRLAEAEAESRRFESRSRGAAAELEGEAAAAQIAAEVTVAAPEPGIVAALRVRRGELVAAGEELGAVVLTGGRMDILLFAPPSVAGGIAPGQEVTLRFDPFPWQRHGVRRGVVSEVASVASVERSSDSPVYRVRVRLADAGGLDLRPDMTLSASIMLEKRSLLDWLLSPLREQWRRGRGERR